MAKNICGRVEEAMKETSHGAKTPEGVHMKEDVNVHMEYIGYFGNAEQVASTDAPTNKSGGNKTSVTELPT